MSKTSLAKKDNFFAKMELLSLALTYSDVRLTTQYSETLPAGTILATKFSRNIDLKNPIVASPMDKVTEHAMAIAMAKLGGLGIIHKGLDPQKQAAVVAKVRFHLNGMIAKPICIRPDVTVNEVLRLREDKGWDFHSFPVTDLNGKLVGIITGDDFDLCDDNNVTVDKIMSTNIIFADQKISIADAYKKMISCRKKILPLLDKDGLLKGIYILSDVKRLVKGNQENFNLDKFGSLQVGAAIGVEDAEERMALLSSKGINLVVIDTAHGDSKGVINTIKFCKKNYPEIDVVAGNISDGQSAKRLVKAGADGIKVGQGPGSICTTRPIAGIGTPQVTAVYNCAKAIRGSGVPVCADGGIEYSGDIPIAIAAGADNVMLGFMLAGTEEAPGDKFFRNGIPYKEYRGMGSLSAMEDNKASRERYGQTGYDSDKFVPEGVETEIPYKGNVDKIIYQLLGGLRSGMGYTGSKTIEDLKTKTSFIRITNAGLKESHPHGIRITRDVPNYYSGR